MTSRDVTDMLVDREHYESPRPECQEPQESDLPSSYTDYLVGLHREIWQGIDTDAYLQRERDAWAPLRDRPTVRARI